VEQWIETAILDCQISNAFPISASIKLVLPDVNGMLSDTVSISNTISAGIPTVANAITPVVSQVNASVNAAQLGNLHNFGKVGIWVKFDTQPSGTTYQLYSNYFVDCKIGLRMKNKLKL
jgi:hypothetical protein